MATVPRITRQLLFKICLASEYSESKLCLDYMAKLKAKGLYTEADNDDIEGHERLEDIMYTQLHIDDYKDETINREV